MTATSSASEHLRTAFLMTILAPLLWSTGSVCIRMLDISPWTILFYRSLLMASTILIWILIKQKRNGQSGKEIFRNILRGMPVSIFICISLCFYILSMTNTGIADSLLIQGTAPVFIIIMGRFYLKDPLSRKTLIAIAGVTAGFMFIFIPALSDSRLSGNIFGLIKAAAFAFSVIALRKLKNIDKLPATAVAALLACIVSAFFTDSFRISLGAIPVLLYFGIVQTGIAFILFSTWAGHVPSTITGIVVLIESVFGPLWVWLFFNEIPPVTTLIGGGIIILALVFNSIRSRWPSQT